MKILFPAVLFVGIILFSSCEKEVQPIQVVGWDRYQEPYFRAHFSYPKGWHMLSEGNKISLYSSPEVVDKFFDPTSKGKIGIQLIVSFEKLDSVKSLESVVTSWRNDMESSGFIIQSTQPVVIDSAPGVKIQYKGDFDERTTLEAIRAMTVKDTMLYTIHYGAFNELFAPNKLLFDEVLNSVTLYKRKPIAAGTESVKPSVTFTEFSNNYLTVSYPDNFEPTFLPRKGDVEFSLELRGYRADCTIHIDVRPAKGLPLEKVVDQNTKNVKSAKRSTAVSGEKAVFISETPAKNIDRRTYFMVKNDKFYRIILTYFSPMKQDYLPAFEKTIASVRVK